MTNAELAILGLIVEQPRHGYEVEQVIDERGMRDWTEVGFSSIYFLLNKLEKAGSILSHIEPAAGRGPSRKVYHPTQKGIQVLRQGKGSQNHDQGEQKDPSCFRPNHHISLLRKICLKVEFEKVDNFKDLETHFG